MLQHGPEHVDLVNPLAGERALSEQVLVHVRHRPGVHVDAGLAGVDAGQARAQRRGDADADPRLDDPVPLDHEVAQRIDDRPVERVSNGPHQSVGDARWKLGIGIERDDVGNTGQEGKVAPFHGEAVLVGPEQPVQVQQLAPLALPAHPGPLARVIHPMAVEDEEGPPPFGGVLAIEAVDQIDRELDPGIAFLLRLQRVGQVGEQREMEIGVSVGQEPHLQLVHHRSHLVGVEQERGDRHHSRAIVRNAGGEIELGEDAWGDEEVRQTVHHVDRGLYGNGDEHECTQKGREVAAQLQLHQPDEDDGQQYDAADVEDRRHTEHGLH